MEKIFETVTLDEEWIILIKSAKNLGISTDEIRHFLKSASNKA